jgi:predicted peptidase
MFDMGAPAPEDERVRRLSAPSGMQYLLFRGPGAPDRAAPLVVFLHGSGEGGDGVATLDRLLVHSLPWVAATGQLPAEADSFLIACPQSSRRLWSEDAPRVLDVMDELCRSEGADPARCYLSGISKGGGGCWDVVAAAPGRVAALLPVSGRVRVADETRARPPVWLFHGALDTVNPAGDAAERLVKNRDPDAVTRVEIDSSAGHDAAFWNRIYMRADVYRWLLEQTSA